MIKEEAEKLAGELKIDITQIVREQWEVKILKALFDSPLGNKICFKGGTALRLAYGSPRFSEDLDFTQIKKIKKNELNNFLKEITKKYPEISISDYQEKFYTILIEFKIKETYLPRKFSVKIEISKRRKKKISFSLLLLVSKTTNLQILARVENIEDIYKEKSIALKERKQSRDLFDLWYIAQKLKEPLPKNLPKIEKNKIKQELNKFLPADFRNLTLEFEKKYGR